MKSMKPAVSALFSACLMVVVLSISGCGKPAKGSTPPVVAVSILPQRYFIRKIAGNSVKVLVMIPPGSSPAVYDPAPGQIRSLSRARLYFRVGHLPFEHAWMSRLQANSRMEVVDTSKGVELRSGHNHAADNHGHTRFDPHIWLSPPAVRIQAKNIYEALKKKFPAKQKQFSTNYLAFLDEITDVHKKVAALLQPVSGKQVLVFHPAWGYLLDLFNIRQKAVEMDGKSPSPSYLHALIKQAKKDGLDTIIVQKQFDTRSARTVADALGGRVLRLDPLAADWANNLVKIARTFSRICK